jgi:hypothetical protein
MLKNSIINSYKYTLETNLRNEDSLNDNFISKDHRKSINNRYSHSFKSTRHSTQ